MSTPKTKPAHTPLPWRPCKVPGGVRGANGHLLTFCLPEKKQDNTLADSLLIVRAVNSHADLLAMVKELRDAAMNTPVLDSSADWTELIEKADKLMAQAEGKA